MAYQINVLFESPTHPRAFTFTDCIIEEDWTVLNYWDDISECLSHNISYAESFLKKVFPNGHDYFLSTVNITYLGDDEE